MKAKIIKWVGKTEKESLKYIGKIYPVTKITEGGCMKYITLDMRSRFPELRCAFPVDFCEDEVELIDEEEQDGNPSVEGE